jgi:cell division protease FtsH
MEDDDDLDGEDSIEYLSNPIKRYERFSFQNRRAIAKFLGKGQRFIDVYYPKWYYGHLLAWTLKNILKSPGYQTFSVHGYTQTEPMHHDVQIDYTKFESCMIDGQIFVQHDKVPFVVTISILLGETKLIQVEALTKNTKPVKQFLKDVEAFLTDNNFYRGKKIGLTNEISFLTIGQRNWESIALDANMKKEIQLNTIGFLKSREKWEKYGIPLKRGIILAGEPGTGKTIICKALMSEADNITCITTDPYFLLHEEYIKMLFSLAQDLSPTMVFIEDVDFIGQERQYFYRGTPVLIALLAEMDGIKENKAVVTIATTNDLETLDKALRERPSRFDRIFKIGRPNSQQRAEQLKYLSKSIPLSEDIFEYILQKTDGLSPAQLQEVVYGIVISGNTSRQETTDFTHNDVDSIIALINYRKKERMGFNGYPNPIMKNKGD